MWSRALPGGTSSAIHAVTVEEPGGARQRRRLVLRRFVRAGWLEREPDLAEHEARVLSLLEGSGVPAPRLVAVDPTGADCGAAAVLMTRLDGAVVWSPDDLGPYLRRLAEALPPIHDVAVPSGTAIRPYDPYYLDEDLRPPDGTSCPEVWERAIEVHAGPPPVDERRLIHRDYHPGNVLWRAGRVTGIVDWASASLGSPEADVGHCRLNLAWHFDQSVADAFTAAWRAVAGRPEYHPYWDVAAIVGTIGGTERRPADARDDEFVAQALARLAPG